MKENNYPFKLPPDKGQQEVENLINRAELISMWNDELPEKLSEDAETMYRIAVNMDSEKDVVYQRKAHWKMITRHTGGRHDEYAINNDPFSPDYGKKIKVIFDTSNIEDVPYCSNCGRRNFEEPTPYCPYCGAKMDNPE